MTVNILIWLTFICFVIFKIAKRQASICANAKVTIGVVAQQISAIPHEWDDFLPANHHLKTQHLQAFENAHVEDITNHYVHVFLKNKLVGLLYLQQFQFKHKHLNFNNNQRLASKMLKLILPKHLSLLVCGNLFRINFQGFYFKNPSYQSLIFDAIKLFNQQNKGCKPCGILLKDCSEIFIEHHSKQAGYRFFDGDVTMEMSRRPHWLTFDDYLKDLQRKYLQRAKKILQAFEPVEKKELTAQEILDNATAINQLYWNVVNKQMVKLGTVNVQYFYELKTDLQQNFEFHALYCNNQMIGFYTYIFYENNMETHYIGLDYDANKIYQIYFNILFLSTQKMIERQDTKIELGRTARDAKANLGAVPKQILNYLCVTNPIAKLALNYFLNRFNQAENQNLITRTPLK